MTRPKGHRGSIINELAEITGIGNSTVRACLRTLEQQTVVLRTYMKGTANKFGEGAGNPMIRLELIDPSMSLPPCPTPIPVVVVDARENEELYQRTRVEPDHDAVVLALLARNEELVDQIAKLQDVVVQLQEQINMLTRQQDRKIPEHLTSRIKDALTPEQWDALTHSAKR